MADAARNKLAAQVIKAEMLGDTDKVKKLKQELELLSASNDNRNSMTRPKADGPKTQKLNPQSSYHEPRMRYQQPTSSVIHMSSLGSARSQSGKIKKFIESTGSLSQMFEQEKRTTCSDEVRMYLKTSAKFTRDDMETKYFAEEIDDSQLILNKSKRHKESHHRTSAPTNHRQDEDLEPCDRCVDKMSQHLIVEKSIQVFLALIDKKPFLSSLSNVFISNFRHSCESFVSANHEQQADTEKLIGNVRSLFKSRGYRCLIMETHLRGRRRFAKNDLTSHDQHFQVHCLPIKEKHFERSRMSFKQALQECGGDWSMNKKLIVTEGRRIQRYLPKGLPYFWVCFDELTNGFGHVIENEEEFSRHFGLEVLSGMLDKEFNPMRLNQLEEYREQFDRCRNFKLLYSESKSSAAATANEHFERREPS